MVMGRSKTPCVTHVGFPVPFLMHIIMNQYLNVANLDIRTVTAGLAQQCGINYAFPGFPGLHINDDYSAKLLEIQQGITNSGACTEKWEKTSVQ